MPLVAPVITATLPSSFPTIHSVRLVVSMLCTPIWVLNVSGDRGCKLCTPVGTSWATLGYDGVGEGAARPAPRQGRARAHPQRFPTAVPRSGHQLHRHGPALRGGGGVQAHAVPALPRQGRADRRAPTPVRSRHPARGVRPRRPHAPRATPRRLRHPRAAVPVHRGGRRDPRPGPPGTRTTPATTRRPLPRGSPRPPARPAPPTPSSSASNWRCSWMAPRPAAESSTPTTFSTAAAIAAVLIDNAIPTAAVPELSRG